MKNPQKGFVVWLFVTISLLIIPFSVQAQSLSGLQDRVSQLFEQPSNVYTIPLATYGSSLLAQVISPPSAINQNINKVYTQNGVYPLIYKKPIFGLQITADATLSSDDSLVRVILTDITNNEYLVFEGSPLANKLGTFSINDFCEETCVLNGIIPVSLKIQVLNGSITLKSIFTVDSADKLNLSSRNTPLTQAAKLKIQQTTAKISQINKFNTQNGKTWKAGLSSVCQMTYSQKKQLFKDSKGVTPDYVPNLQGFDCYKSGIFSMFEENASSKTTLSSAPITNSSTITLPDKWDWRNVNGENWMTSVKNQGSAGTCWAFSTIGSLESSVNVYYNQHLDLNLSEQLLIDCGQTKEGVTSPIPELTTSHLYYGNYGIIKNFGGITDEDCDPYVARGQNISGLNCSSSYICSNWKDRLWQISDHFLLRLFTYDSPLPPPSHQYMSFTQDINQLKVWLIKNGPLSSRISEWGHAIVLAGYGTVKAGDLIYPPTIYYPQLIISQGDSMIGKTYWIYKNSWAENWGEEGYFKFVTPSPGETSGDVSFGPFIPPTDHSYWPAGFDGTVSVVDKDSDGYCSWGISDQPPVGSNIPASCKKDKASEYIKDCDDSKANLGPFKSSTDFTCSTNLPLTPISTSTPSVPIHNPLSPITISAQSQNKGELTLTWTSVSWPVGSVFEIERAMVGGTGNLGVVYNRIDVATGDMRSYTDTGILPSLSADVPLNYRYQIRAKLADGTYSAYSNIIEITITNNSIIKVRASREFAPAPVAVEGAIPGADPARGTSSILSSIVNTIRDASINVVNSVSSVLGLPQIPQRIVPQIIYPAATPAFSPRSSPTYTSSPSLIVSPSSSPSRSPMPSVTPSNSSKILPTVTVSPRETISPGVITGNDKPLTANLGTISIRAIVVNIDEVGNKYGSLGEKFTQSKLLEVDQALNRLNAFVKQSSYGKAQLQWTTSGVYELGSGVCSHVAWSEKTNDLIQRALQVADSQTPLTDYSYYLIVHPMPDCRDGTSWSFEGRGQFTAYTLNGRIVHLRGTRISDLSDEYLFHEFGHSLAYQPNTGIGHPDYLNCPITTINGETRIALSNVCPRAYDWNNGIVPVFTIMSAKRGILSDYNSIEKENIGWITDSNIVTTSVGKYTLSPIEQTGSGPKALRIPITGITGIGGEDYVVYVSFRQPIGYAHPATPANKPNGVILDITENNNISVNHFLVTNSTSMDAPLQIGMPYRLGTNGPVVTLTNILNDRALITISSGSVISSSPIPSYSPTPSPTPIITMSPRPSTTPSPTYSPSPSYSSSPLPTYSYSPSPTYSPIYSPSPTYYYYYYSPTPTPTPTYLYSPSSTNLPSSSPTLSGSPVSMFDGRSMTATIYQAITDFWGSLVGR